MIYLKNTEQIEIMQEAGNILWEAHQIAKDMLEHGITTASIDKEVDKFIVSKDSISLFKTVKRETYFPGAICTSINEQVVHGIPGLYYLKEGDILSLDIGLKYKGWCVDSAMTHGIGEIGTVAEKLLDVTRKALYLSIEELAIGKMWSSISNKMELYVEKAGFSLVKELAGHGIGKELWEEPQVPNYYTNPNNKYRIKLQKMSPKYLFRQACPERKSKDQLSQLFLISFKISVLNSFVRHITQSQYNRTAFSYRNSVFKMST